MPGSTLREGWPLARLRACRVIESSHPLCSYCQSIFLRQLPDKPDDYSTLELYCPHRSSALSMKAAADDGCQLCRMILGQLADDILEKWLQNDRLAQAGPAWNDSRLYYRFHFFYGGKSNDVSFTSRTLRSISPSPHPNVVIAKSTSAYSHLLMFYT